MSSCKCNTYGGRFDLYVPSQRYPSLGIPGLAVLTQGGYASPGMAVLTQGNYGYTVAKRHGSRYASPGMAVLTQGGYGRIRRNGGYGAGEVVWTGSGAADAGKSAGAAGGDKVEVVDSGKPSTGEVILGLGTSVKDSILAIFGARSQAEVVPPPAFDAGVEQPKSYLGPAVAVGGVAALAIGIYALTRK